MSYIDYIGNPNEVAKAIGIDAHTLRRYARDGKLRHAVKIGERWSINATKEWPELGLRRKV